VIKIGKGAVYGLENSRDLLEKLRWERDELVDASRQAPDRLCYCAFNASVTAWHLADWVWRDLTLRQRQVLEKKSGESLDTENERGGAFRHYLKTNSRALAICRELATASKHVEVTQGADETIDAVMNVGTERTVDSTGSEIMVGDSHVVVQSWSLDVQDGESHHPLLDVLDEAIDYWTQFLDTYA